MKALPLHVLVLSLLPFFLIGCGLFKKDEEEVKAKPRLTRVVGEVTSVHPEQGFVLFRRYGPGELLTGGALSSRSLDGRRAADLQLSPEKLGRFYTADYSQDRAAPRDGDLVVLTKLSNDTKNSEFVTEKAE